MLTVSRRSYMLSRPSLTAMRAAASASANSAAKAYEAAALTEAERRFADIVIRSRTIS